MTKMGYRSVIRALRKRAEMNKITITDTTGTTTSFEPTAIGVIENQHGYLLRLKNDGRNPSQKLLDDIAGYEIILKSENPEEMATKYLDFKIKEREKSGKHMTVTEAVKKLGWWPK